MLIWRRNRRVRGVASVAFGPGDDVIASHGIPCPGLAVEALHLKGFILTTRKQDFHSDLVELRNEMR